MKLSSFRKRCLKITVSTSLIVLSTKINAVTFIYPPNPVPGTTTILNSSTSDSLTVNSGGVADGLANVAVQVNIDANNAINILNNTGGTIQNASGANATINATQIVSGATAPINITNFGTIQNTGPGPVFNFTTTTVPVTIIDQSNGVITGANINLSTLGSVRLQLGTTTPGTSPAPITTPITGNINSTVDVQNNYNTAPGGTITNVGTILNNGLAGTSFAINQNITGWTTFTTFPGSTTSITGGTTGAAPDGIVTNQGNLILNNGTLGGTRLIISNSGVYTQNGGLINLTGGTFLNLASGVSNLNIGNYIANTNNFGTINIQPGLNPISGTAFVNNGTLNLFRNTFPANISSNVTNSVINLRPPSGTFTTTNPWTNTPIVTLNPPATSFIVVTPITGLQILTMYPGMTTFIQGGGSITTSLLTLNNAGSLNINPGGTFVGALSGTAATTLNLQTDFSTSGPIAGVGTINANAGTFTINHPVTGYSIFQNNSTVVMNGGGLSGGMRGNNVSTLIINRDFATAGTLGEILPLGSLIINPGATLTMNNPINANTLTNNGNLALTAPQTLTGNYIQTGTFTTSILNNIPGNFGQLSVTGTATVEGTIHAIPVNSALINTGDVFDVIVATTLVDNNPTVTTQPNPFVSFTRDVGPGVPPNVIRLRANRTPLVTFFGHEPPKAGLAAALDTINITRVSPGLRNTILALRRTPNIALLEEFLLQLIPDVSGSLIMPTLNIQDLLLDKVAYQIDRVRLRRMAGYTAGDVLGDSGYAAGDMSDNHDVYGPYFFGNYIRQERVGIVDGYNAATGGIGALTDYALNACGSRAGAALNYAQTRVRSIDTGNKNNISSVQGTLYGTFEYGWLYIDGMLSAAVNQYRTNRNIAFLGQHATAKFNGIQKNAMLRAGFNIPIGIVQLTPIIRTQYTWLNLDQYTETGADPALIVVGRQEEIANTAYGVKLMDISTPDTFLPELHIMFINYNKNPNFIVTSSFVGGGPAFEAIGPQPSRTGTNIGGGVTARLNPRFIITGRYDYIYRKNLQNHNLLLMLRYFF